MVVQTPEVTDEIISTCQAANVQLMDGTMWMHNERTALMQETVAARLDPSGLGPLKAVTATFCFAGKWPNIIKVTMSFWYLACSCPERPEQVCCCRRC